MIETLYIRNYKSIDEATVELSQFSCFVGRNAAGKSNILQTIALVRDLVGGDSSTVKARREVTLIAQELFNISSNDTNTEIQIKFSCVDTRLYRYNLRFVFSLGSIPNKFEKDIVIKEEELKIISEDGKEERLVYIRKENELHDGNKKSIPLAVDADRAVAASYKDSDVNRVRDYFRPTRSTFYGPDLRSLVETISRPTDANLGGLLIRLRQNVELYKQFTDIINRITGLRDIDSVVINDDKAISGDDKKEYVLLLQEKNQQMSLKLASVGDLRTLLFIASAISLPPGSFMVIDEIENGMHQIRVRQLLQYLQTIVAKNDIQIIFSTHSSHIINCLRPEDIILVQKKLDSQTRVASLSRAADVAKIEKYLGSSGDLFDYVNSEMEAI